MSRVVEMIAVQLVVALSLYGLYSIAKHARGEELRIVVLAVAFVVLREICITIVKGAGNGG